MSQTISILYFASLGESINCQSEDLALPENTSTVGSLRALLAERGPQWHSQLLKVTVRAAVNQAIVDENAAIKPGDEVAFFPPVTGG